MASRDARRLIAEETMKALDKGVFSKYCFRKELADAIEASKLYKESDNVRLMKKLDTTPGSVEVVQCTTLQGCNRYKDKKLCVLNFASARNPGGGFMKGSQAQEESLVRASGLYPCLTKFHEDFYLHHRKGTPGFYSHSIIESPDVPIFRDDMGKAIQPYEVTFVTSPAPNRNAICRDHGDSAVVTNTLKERIRRILIIMKNSNPEVAVLGAYGCGVFGNDPVLVASIFNSFLKTKEFSFPHVIFAITDPTMVSTFKRILNSA